MFSANFGWNLPYGYEDEDEIIKIIQSKRQTDKRQVMRKGRGSFSDAMILIGNTWDKNGNLILALAM